MIKTTCRVLAIFLVLSAANSVCSEDQVSRWKYYASDAANNDHYYDTTSIVRTKNDIVKIWEKKVATDKSDEIMKAMKEQTELKEINCSMKRIPFTRKVLLPKRGAVENQADRLGGYHQTPGWKRSMILCARRKAEKAATTT